MHEKMFTFPALPAGPPSRRNWYRELLEHADCGGRSVAGKHCLNLHVIFLLWHQNHI